MPGKPTRTLELNMIKVKISPNIKASASNGIRFVNVEDVGSRNKKQLNMEKPRMPRFKSQFVSSKNNK